MSIIRLFPARIHIGSSLILLLTATFLTATFLSATVAADEIGDLEKWLAQPPSERGNLSDQAFAVKPISKKQASQSLELLWADHLKQMKLDRKKAWDDKLIKMGPLEMKFDFKVYGEKPRNGRSLYISMHGGGGAPARVNEGQWKNQIRLYQPEEGVYLAPRAPTDSWNLWHQAHIDKFFTRIISDAIVFEQVDPNRVYIMGYSAGGDGVYQLAPRMADQLAAAAMMAGHPNDAQPFGLRNIGFALYMGGKDSAYNRNKKAEEWKKWLAELKQKDPQGYAHDVVIYPQFAHWMNRKDAAAVPWMSKFTRNPFPRKIVWRQSSVTHGRFYWLAVDEPNRQAGAFVVASRQDQAIRFERVEKVKQIRIRLNDEMMDLDQPVSVEYGELKLSPLEVTRTIESLARTLAERGDPKSVYSVELTVDFEKKTIRQ